jgi:hypothetical protein
MTVAAQKPAKGWRNYAAKRRSGTGASVCAAVARASRRVEKQIDADSALTKMSARWRAKISSEAFEKISNAEIRAVMFPCTIQTKASETDNNPLPHRCAARFQLRRSGGGPI